MRHLIGSDSWYLFDITGDQARRIDEDQMDLLELRVVMEADGTAWSTFLAQDLDPAAVLKESTRTTGTRGKRLSASGSPRRCITGPTIGARSARPSPLGVEPPGIDVWDFGLEAGRVVEGPPAS
jgi:hypothetical protein